MRTKSLTKVTLLSLFVMSVVTAVTLNSCQKESIKPKVTPSNSTATSIKASSALIVSEVNNLMFSMHKTQKGLVPGGADSNSCVIITTDTISKPHTVSFNYGSNCIGDDGKVRSGIVTISYADPDIRLVNNVFTATYQNYTVNGSPFNGSVSVTNIGANGNGNLVLLQTGSFYTKAPQEISADTLNINYQYEWIAGVNSSPAANWQFSVTGGWTSTYTPGQMDSLVITTPLIKNAKNPGCNYYISGTQYSVTKTPQGEDYTYEDFGNPGGCSGQESVTHKGITTVQSQQ